MITDAREKASPTPSEERPTVAIIGGGFGGLNAAKRLAGLNANIIVIDKENYHLFQPLLYQVATSGLEPGDIASPIRSVLSRKKNVSVIHGEVVDIDRQERRVILNEGSVDYDFLIVAAGMENNYFGRREWEVIAPGLKTLNDALECRRRILQAFENAEWTDDEELQKALLTFVVVGAGPTGVEMAGAIKEIACGVMKRDFRNIDPRMARVLLVDAGPRVLSAFSEDLSKQALNDLRDMGIEVRLNSLVESISTEGLDLGGEFIASRTVIWAAGVRASPLAASLNTALDPMGRVLVKAELCLKEDPRVFVIGDLAHVKDQKGDPLPGLAPVAIQQGQHVADQIKHYLNRSAPYEAFQYRDKGKMATLGRAKAVAEFGGRTFSGLGAWLLWLFVHLLFLIGFRNRLFVLMTWFYAYVGGKRSARLILETPESILYGSELKGVPDLNAGIHFLENPNKGNSTMLYNRSTTHKGGGKDGGFDESTKLA